MTARFYFPLLLLRPSADWEPLSHPPYRLSRRLWQTSTFDLATLATKHALNLPYQVMDLMLDSCNLEVEVSARDREEAEELVRCLLLGLYLEGLSPTVTPFVTTYSVNEYSGINSRDEDTLRDKLPAALQEGLTSASGKLEAWPVLLSFRGHVYFGGLNLSPETFQAAAGSALSWRALERKQAALGALREAAINAPLLASAAQSILHIWCGLEALFPRVGSEVSFQIALYLCQLQREEPRAIVFERVRDAYRIRSRIAHGTIREATAEDWEQAWSLAMVAGRSVLARKLHPTEDQLLAEMLAKPQVDS